MTSILLDKPQTRYQSGVKGRKIVYPIAVTQTADIGKLLVPHGRAVDWEFTPKSPDTELLHLTATDEVHIEIFNAAFLSEQATRRIRKILGV